MIRVNLLPRRRDGLREGSRAWMAILAVVFLLEMIAIVIVHAQKKADLEDQLQRNREVEAGIAEKKAKIANHESVKKQLTEYQAREDAIAKLQAGRTGPTSMMLEISRLLSPKKMPSVDPAVLEKLRRENPQAVPNEKWDPHRLWLASFREIDRVVSITGSGRSNDDVAEFIRRMTISKYFTEVSLVRTEERVTKLPNSPVSMPEVFFDLHAKAKY